MRRIYAVGISAVITALFVLLAVFVKPLGGPVGERMSSSIVFGGSGNFHFEKQPHKIEVNIPISDTEAEYEWFVLRGEGMKQGYTLWRKVPFVLGESRMLALEPAGYQTYLYDGCGEEYNPVDCYKGTVNLRSLAYRLESGLYKIYIRKANVDQGSLDAIWNYEINFTVGRTEDIDLPTTEYNELSSYITLKTTQEVYPENTRAIVVSVKAAEGDAILGHGTAVEKYIDGEWRVASLGDGGIDSRRETISIKKGEEGRFAYVFNGTLPLDAGRYRIVAAFRHEINGVRRGRDKYAAAEFTVSGKSEPKRAESVSAKLTAFSEEVFADVEITNNNDSAVWVMNGSESSGISYELIRIDDDLGLEYIVRHRVRFLAEVAPGETFTVKARYMLPEYLISRIDDAYLRVYDADGREMLVKLKLAQEFIDR